MIFTRARAQHSPTDRPPSEPAHRFGETGLTEQPDAINRAKPIVLLPFDESPENDETVTLGISMAREMHAQLLLLHAVLLNLSPYGPINLRKIEAALCEEVIAQAEKTMLSAQEQGVSAIFALEEGAPAAVINRAAARWQPDLIVMSAHQHDHFLSQIFRRRTIDKVIRHVKCPVLVLQTNQKEKKHV